MAREAVTKNRMCSLLRAEAARQLRPVVCGRDQRPLRGEESVSCEHPYPLPVECCVSRVVAVTLHVGVSGAGERGTAVRAGPQHTGTDD